MPGGLGVTFGPARFIKLHVPMQVLKQYVEILKLRMTLKVSRKERKKKDKLISFL